MKRTISLLFLILISCGKPTKEKSEKTSVKSNLPDTIVIHKTKEWYTDLIENYIAHSEKKLIVDDRKTGKIDWVLDDTEVTDTTNYYIFNIGHTETDEGNTNPRFTSDGWIYIDSLSQKIYEYDLPNDELVLWKKN